MNCIFRKIAIRLLITAIFLFAFAWLAMLLWNSLIPDLFHGPTLTSYWQALGLLVLVRIMTGGLCRGGPGGPFGPGMFWRHRLQKKLAGMSPEERQKFMSSLHQCGWHGEQGSGDCPMATPADPANSKT